MKQYFIDRLTKSMRDIKSLEKKIIKAANDLDMPLLIKLPKNLISAKDMHLELTKDLCKYCLVEEVIEISNLTDKYDGPLNLLYTNDLRYAYEYFTDPVSIGDRDKLVERFGYSLKSIKVK